jgi:hypothetical protein
MLDPPAQIRMSTLLILLNEPKPLLGGTQRIMAQAAINKNGDIQKLILREDLIFTQDRAYSTFILDDERICLNVLKL